VKPDGFARELAEYAARLDRYPQFLRGLADGSGADVVIVLPVEVLDGAAGKAVLLCAPEIAPLT